MAPKSSSVEPTVTPPPWATGSIREARDEWLATYYAASPKTVRNYRAITDRMLEALEADGIADLADVSPRHLTLFLAAEWERPRRTTRHDGDRADQNRISTSMVVATHAVLSIFWKWVHHQGYTAANPMASVRRPATPKLTRTALSADEAHAIIAKCREKDDPIVAARDEAIVTLFLGTGLRVRALLGLRLGDIDWANRRLLIRDDKGQGIVQRRVRLSPKAYQALRRWVRMREKYRVSSDALWISIRRRPMTYDAIWRVIRSLGEYAGVDGPAHPHRLRHTAATELYRETKDILIVKAFLGHSKVQTTERYLRRLGLELEDADYRTPDEWLA